MNDDAQKTISENRIQTSFLAKVEKRALIWMGERTPSFISPDMLTYLGFIGLGLSGVAYYLSHLHWGYLILASVGLFINWVGDSLDGTLARVRKKERPKYGYYLDHLVDAFGITAMIFGLAYSGLVHQPFIWLVLALFFIASINTYLATHVVEIFKISYLKVSTTEARVALIILNTVLIFIDSITIGRATLMIVDIIAALTSLFLLVATLRSAILNLSKLNRQEKAKWTQNTE